MATVTDDLERPSRAATHTCSSPGETQRPRLGGVENVPFSHPEIVDVAVYGRADDKWGEVPVAAVVLTEGSQLDIGTLDAWLDDKLARFKHPKHLVTLGELPRNASGKVTKGVLRAGDPA